MHKAVARDVLRRAGWTEPQLVMALRIMAYDGARSAAGTADVIAAFAERSEDASEAAAWRGVVAKLRADPQQAEALWALRRM